MKSDFTVAKKIRKKFLGLCVIVQSLIFTFILYSESKLEIPKVFESPREELELDSIDKFFSEHKEYVSDGFDFPVGKPNAKGYIDKQPFGKNFHLGEDWNAVGRNDYGDPVYAVSHGIVKFVGDVGPGWGTVIMMTHLLPNGKRINSLYAHLSKINVSKGDRIRKGKVIGRIGDANGRYGPHLHFEMRDDFLLPTGPGYSRNLSGYLNPKVFIRKNRKLK
ncbi:MULTISPECIES: M23 family metallopeptidase [Leptospira]|uniref:M23 family metallopeptidase n=1 Tax=Leptospira TaxID=171 RepID=UPI0002BD6E65|nr:MULTISPECIES: M23 family metallopeptidase [Leptospira]EMK03355.1 peptidase, M23 family [Leptospira kirschneri]KXZ29177.1 peptidase M23 [Leptospira kirschneri]KXZ33920.1 peptidase M23 [Leptospira sp. ZV016]